MSALPNFTGPGYFAGEAPDGLTTIAGTPTSASVRVYWRDPSDPQAPDVLVASTQSAADGTWQITGLNPALRYVVRAQKSQFDDVTVVGAAPSRSDVIAYVDQLVPRAEDDFGDVDGLTGHVLLDSGLPPFTCEAIQPLPYGLSARVDGRKLLIEGESIDNGLWESVVRVTASNGVWADVPVQVQIQVLHLDPHWDKVVSLLHFDGDFTDETGGVVTTSGDLSFTPGKFSEAVRFTRSVTPRTVIRKSGLNIGSGDFTIEAWVRLSSVSQDNTIFDFRLGTGISSLPLVECDRGNLYVWVSGSYLIGPMTSAMSASHFKHLALVRTSGVLSLWLDGVLVGTAGHTYDMGNAQVSIGRSMNTASSNTNFDLAGDIDELRITTGVARYTENFTPPDKRFPNR